MQKPSERVLYALNTLDQALVEWLSVSLAQIDMDLRTAPDSTFRQLQGQAQAISSILNSASNARQSLERIRNPEVLRPGQVSVAWSG